MVYPRGQCWDQMNCVWTHAPKDTEDLTLGLMMDCCVKIICRKQEEIQLRNKEIDEFVYVSVRADTYYSLKEVGRRGLKWENVGHWGIEQAGRAVKMKYGLVLNLVKVLSDS